MLHQLYRIELVCVPIEHIVTLYTLILIIVIASTLTLFLIVHVILSFQGPNYNLSHITTRNVSKSAKHYSFAEPRGVKAHFIMDHNGILVLSGVSCIFHPIEKRGISDDSNKAKSTFESKLVNNILWSVVGIFTLS